MLPTLNLGPWQVSTYGAVGALTLVLCGLYAFHRLRRLGLPPHVLLRCLFLVVLSGFAAVFVATSLINLVLWFVPSAQPEGTSVIWAFLGGGSVTALCAWKLRLSVGRALDLATPPWALAHVLGRVGCLANGCCYGLPTDSWLGMYLPDADGVWQIRYPTQIMSGGADLLIFLTLLTVEWVGRRRAFRVSGPGSQEPGWPFDGFLFLFFLLCYGLTRFVMAFFRESGPPLVGPFAWMHLNALIMFVAAAVLLVWGLYRVWRARPSP